MAEDLLNMVFVITQILELFYQQFKSSNERPTAWKLQEITSIAWRTNKSKGLKDSTEERLSQIFTYTIKLRYFTVYYEFAK